MALASAGPYASLHLAPERQPCQHPTTRFLQTGCPFCHPTNSIKALKEITNAHTQIKYKTHIWRLVNLLVCCYYHKYNHGNRHDLLIQKVKWFWFKTENYAVLAKLPI